MKERGDGMRHFSLEKWADFARDVVGAEEKKAMQSHIEGGCKECAKLLVTWKHVQDAARREAANQPPDNIVRTVKAMGAIHGLGSGRPVTSPIAKLLFDSFRSPLPAGVRSTAVNSRQLLYGVGDYRLDIRIEPQEDSDKVVLLGQILNSSEPDRPIGVMSVVLKKGKRVLAESVTNQLGEFQLEFNLESSLQLQAGLPHGELVQIPLVEPANSKADVEPQSTDSIGVKRLMQKAIKSTKRKV